MPSSPLLRVLSAVLATLASSTLKSAPEPTALTLVCEVKGELLPLASVDGEVIQVGRSAGVQAAPEAARWSLQGDLRHAARLLSACPRYTLERDARHQDGRQRARVHLEHLIDVAAPRDAIKDFGLQRWAEALSPHQDPFAHHWSGDATRPGVVVAIWMLGDRALHVMAKPLPQVSASREYRLTFDFFLSATEAAGQPVFLLWQDGAWVPARPFTEHEPTQAAWRAVMFNDPDGLAQAIHDGARVGSKAKLDGATLTHYAAASGAGAALQQLVHARPKAAFDPADQGDTPLQHAAARGRAEAVAILLGHCSRVRGHASLVSDALIRAATHGHGACVDLLLPWLQTHDPKALLSSELRRLPWENGFEDLCTTLGQETPIVVIKGEKPPGPAQQAETLNRLLVAHAGAGRRGIVRHLLTTMKWTPDNAWKGLTPLTAAAMAGDEAMVRELLDSGANPSLASAKGLTPLIAATQAEAHAAVELLLARGATASATNDEGMSALHFAAQSNAAPIVAMLLNAGADLQICSIRDMTPLDLALFTGATASAHLLMERGACIGLGAPYSRDLILAAVSNDLDGPIATAIKQGWPATSTFAGTWPALRVAELLGAARCAETLRAAGAVSHAHQPAPVVDAARLDAPLKLLAAPVAIDPRRPDQVFPATRTRVRVLVDPHGRTLFPTTENRSNPHVMLAALKAAQQARFEPPRSAGKPVAVFTTVDIDLPASRDRVFAVEDADEPPPIRYKTPPYQPLSVRPDRDARVLVSYVINVLGRVEQLEILESTGQAYADSVRLAMSQWSFAPLTHHGTPIAVRMMHSFSFDRGR